MNPEIPQIKKTLEQLALRFKSYEGSLARAQMDNKVLEMLEKYVLNSTMRMNLWNYYEKVNY